jgi:hypothetical protein
LCEMQASSRQAWLNPLKYGLRLCHYRSPKRPNLEPDARRNELGGSQTGPAARSNRALSVPHPSAYAPMMSPSLVFRATHSRRSVIL